MTIYYINTGTSPNKGDGDTLRTAFNKINLNFQYLSTATGNGGGSYTLPIASNSTLGGVKGGVSTGIVINPEGVLYSSINNTATNGITFATGAPDGNGVRTRVWQLSVATTTTLGGVRSSPTILITDDGKAQTRYFGTGSNGITFSDADWTDPNNLGHIMRTWSLLPATTSTLGGVKVYPGGSIKVQSDGVVSVATQYISGTGTQVDIVWPDDGVTPPTVAYNVLPATGAVLGGVKIGAGVNVDVDGTISVTTGAFALQTATNTILGGVKIGGGFSIAPDGTISAQSPLVPIADTPPGGASDGELWWSSNATNLYIRYAGAWIDASPSSGSGGTYTLTTATHSALGGVKIGTGINIDGNGVISVTTASFALQTATTSTLGGVKVGAGLSVAGDGTISAIGTTGTQAVFIADYPPYPSYEGELWWDSASNNLLINYSGIWIDATPATPPPSPYSLPTATQSVLGGVKIDNVTITIDQNGVISSNGGGGGGSTTWGLLGNKNNSSGPDTIALGTNAGYNSQGLYAISFGSGAGQFNQGQWSVAIGVDAGGTDQAATGIAIGKAAGQVSQSISTVAIGNNAATLRQGQGATAIGDMAGFSDQGFEAVALGNSAGSNYQGVHAIAIGSYAGLYSQGAGAIAIGNHAGANTQTAYSVVINASGSVLDAPTAGLYIAPIRPDTTTSATTWSVFYNSATKELTTASATASSLPTASQFTLGGIKIGSGLTISGNGTVSVPTASTSTFGIIKLGTGFVESPAGTFNVDYSGTLPVATTSTLGAVKLSTTGALLVEPNGQLSNLYINTASNGLYFITYPPDGVGHRIRDWRIAQATTTTLGGVVIGSNIEINTATSAISVPKASTSTLGVIKVFPGGVFGVSNDGTLDFAASFANGTGTQYVLTWPDDGITPPVFSFNLLPATTSTIGGVKVDGTTINIDGNGVISSVGGGATFTVTNVSYFTNDVEYLTSSTLNQYVNAIIIQSDTAPASTTSTFWYDTVSGRTYTYFDGSWVDTNPNIAILPTASTSTLGVVKIGTGISIDNSGTISVGALPAVFELTSSTAVVSLSSDGRLTLPNGIEFGLPWGAGYPAITSPEVTDFIIRTSNTTTSNSWSFSQDGVTRFPSDLVFRGDNGAQAIIGNEGESSFNLKLTTQNGIAKINLPSWNDMYISGVQGIDVVVADNTWTFRKDSILQLPVGGDIVDSNNVSVLGGGGGATTWANITDITNNNGPTNIAIGQSSGENQKYASVAIGAYAGRSDVTTADYVSGDTNTTTLVVSAAYNIFKNMVITGTGFTSGQTVVSIFNTNTVIISDFPDSTPSGTLTFTGVQDQYAVAIGAEAGRINQSAFAVAIGREAGVESQGWGSVAIGYGGGQVNQGVQSIGILGGNAEQGDGAIAIGARSGGGYHTSHVYASGNNIDTIVLTDYVSGIVPGMTITGTGFTSGQYVTSVNWPYTLNISAPPDTTPEGLLTFTGGQGANAIAIGNMAGLNLQAANSIVINASGSPLDSQWNTAGLFIAPIRNDITNTNNVLYYDDYTKELTYGPASTASTYTLVAATTATLGGVKIDGTTIHIDVNGVISSTAAGSSSTWAALGGKVGLTGPTEIALGYTAGFAQGSNSIALGNGAGQGTQSAESVAIGHMAAQNGQGANAIAIGSYAGQTSQPANSIVINASGSAINGSASGFFVAPVREDTFIDNIAYYNTVTNEVTYAPNIITAPHQLSSGTVSVTVLGTATNYFSQGHAHNLGEVDMTTGTYIVFDSTLNQDNWSGAIGDGVSTSSLGLFTRVGPIELIAGAYSNRWDFNTNGTLTLPSGGTISYTPAVAGNWAGAAPTTIQQAIDRLAAAVKALNGTGA